jgi:hypothetical protein
MKIKGPLAIDISTWVDHINIDELEDAGVQSVIVGLYPITKNGKVTLNPVSRSQCEAVANSSMILQVYMWDDIILSPDAQVQWLLDTVKTEGFPVTWIWADQEQWWTNWTSYYSFRRGEIPFSQVPKAASASISSHYQTFASKLKVSFPHMGVYTNNSFVVQYTSGLMNSWLSGHYAWVSHYGRQPKVATKMTWDFLKEHYIPDYDIILSAGQKENLTVGHQFTGDTCILPGSYDVYNRALSLDVSVFKEEFLEALRNNQLPVIPIPPTPTVTGYKVNKFIAYIYPDSTGPAKKAFTSLLYGKNVEVSEKVGLYSHITNPVDGWTATSNLIKR